MRAPPIAGPGRFARARRGAAALEFALVLPTLLIMLLGSVEVERLVRLRMALASAAQTMAALAAMQTGTPPATLADDCTGAQLLLAPFGSTNVAIAVADVARDSSAGAPTLAWQDNGCGQARAIAAPTSLAAPLVPGVGDQAIVAVATYTYTDPLPFLLPTTISLSATGYARPR